jgi:hypothetical protein
VNLELLVEERSAEQALRVLLPRIVPNADFEVRVFRGKIDLLKRLPDRLKGYATWITRANTCLVVLVDRDDDDCLKLKADMEQMASAAGLLTVAAVSLSRQAEVLNRIAVEELEAWFFGTFQRSVRPIHGYLHRLGSGRSTDVPMRFLVALGKPWSMYFRSVVIIQAALPRSRQLPRSHNT